VERIGIVGFSSSHILMAVEAKAAGHHGLQKYLYGSSIFCCP
jgi:hypothetical protein